MTIDELNQRLDNVISTYEYDADEACRYCDEYTGNALYANHKAISKALMLFKAEILTFLNQQ